MLYNTSYLHFFPALDVGFTKRDFIRLPWLGWFYWYLFVSNKMKKLCLAYPLQNYYKECMFIQWNIPTWIQDPYFSGITFCILSESGLDLLSASSNQSSLSYCVEWFEMCNLIVDELIDISGVSLACLNSDTLRKGIVLHILVDTPLIKYDAWLNVITHLVGSSF